MNIIEAMRSPKVWGNWFKPPPSWAPWEAFLGALFGLPLSEDQLDLFRRCTGRASPPPGGSTEAWLVCGRRAGKSRVLSLIAVYLAAFRNWRSHLAPGETATIRVIATDRKQARVIHRYCRGLLALPDLEEMIERDTDEEITLSNGVAIEIGTATLRSNRGLTLIAALCDEQAFWRNEEGSANLDSEIIASLRPAMATIPGSMLLCASSPYARRGETWNAFRRYHGQDDAPALVWHAATKTMNPSVPQRVLDEAYERDPADAAAEYGAQFRDDIDAYISREVVDALIVPGRFELPYIQSHTYRAFVDPSGGQQDSMTCAVAHRERDLGILDLVYEAKPPFSTEAVVESIVEILQRYRITEVTGDRYGAAWVADQFLKRNIRYEVSEKPKSDIYRELLPLLSSRRVELLDNKRLVNQLVSLERRTARGGRDSIDHPPGGHDDLINAAAGALVATAAPTIGEMYIAIAERFEREGLGRRYFPVI